MALDTQAKRRAAMEYGQVWATTLPIPDGSISSFDRSHLAWSYYYAITIISIPGCATVTTSQLQTATATTSMVQAATVTTSQLHTATATTLTCAINLPVEHEDLSALWKFEDDSDLEFE